MSPVAGLINSHSREFLNEVFFQKLLFSKVPFTPNLNICAAWFKKNSFDVYYSLWSLQFFNHLMHVVGDKFYIYIAGDKFRH